jgi:F-type H+-transporting ATPase subunit epsilon
MFHLSIVTPENVIYEGEVSSVIVPGGEGYLGVLADHAPLISTIKPGKVTIKDKSQKELIFAVSYGFFEVSANRATLLADAVEDITKIDYERSRQAMDRARKRLADMSGAVDIIRAQRALERAHNRITLFDANRE